MEKSNGIEVYLDDPSPVLDDRSKGLADSPHSIGVQLDRVPRAASHSARVVDHLHIHIDMN